MTKHAIAVDDLKNHCDINQFEFESTRDLEPISNILFGQPRATRGLEFGLGIESHGYNIFVVNESDPEQIAAIAQFVSGETHDAPTPDDWVYVHNFESEHRPKAIRLPAGRGSEFQSDMKTLIERVKQSLERGYEDEIFRESADHIRHVFNEKQDEIMANLRAETGQADMTPVRGPAGFVLMPLVDGRAMTEEQFRQLPIREQERWHTARQDWEDRLDATDRALRNLDIDTRGKLKELETDMASNAISFDINTLLEKYEGSHEIIDYVNQVQEDILDNLIDFYPRDEDDNKSDQDLRRYLVNLFVDHSNTDGAPVIIELNPRYIHLIGRIEYESQHQTHFTNIKAGSLHRANGGYLILKIVDLGNHRTSYETFKRALTSGEVPLQSSDRTDGNQVLAKSLDPEPIPLKVKVILMGDSLNYEQMHRRDKELARLFKVKAEFDDVMPRTAKTELDYARMIATYCNTESLNPFDRSAVGQIVEFGSRLCDDQARLSTRFNLIADLLRESHYWSNKHGRDTVTAEDVRKARTEQDYRVNLFQERIQSGIHEGYEKILTSGSVIGEVNGLSVMSSRDYTFGAPDRITAKTFRGEQGVVHIDREVDNAESSHNKGLLSITSFLGAKYAQKEALAFSATLTFEQFHGIVSGDSAASAELYALLSSIAELPIKQSIAVTGAIGQSGEVQAIGSVNEKIEGFFEICRARGLTGEHGVILPATNCRQLMLKDEVIEAVEAGLFRIWAINTVEEGMEILTGVAALPADEAGDYPDGSLHELVLRGLERLKPDDDEDDEDEDDDD